MSPKCSKRYRFISSGQDSTKRVRKERISDSECREICCRCCCWYCCRWLPPARPSSRSSVSASRFTTRLRRSASAASWRARLTWVIEGTEADIFALGTYFTSVQGVALHAIGLASRQETDSRSPFINPVDSRHFPSDYHYLLRECQWNEPSACSYDGCLNPNFQTVILILLNKSNHHCLHRCFAGSSSGSPNASHASLF